MRQSAPALTGKMRHWYRLLLLFLVVLFFVGCYFMSSITIPFLITMILAYLLSPLVGALERRGLPRFLASLLILLVVLAAIFLVLSFVLPMLFVEVKVLADDPGALDAGLKVLEHKLAAAIPFIHWQDVRTDLAASLDAFLKQLVKSIPNILQNMVTVVYFSVIIPFLLFFFLKDGRSIIRRMISLVPNRFFEVAAYMVEEIDVKLGRFLRGIFIENSIIGLLAITGLSLIGLKNAALIGCVVGITNVIPYLGPTIGFIVGSLVVLIDPVGNPSLIAVLVVISIVQLADNVLVYPLAIGKSVNIHPISIIASLLLGDFLFGIIGMLLAVPLMTSITILFKTFNRAMREYRL